MEWLTLIILGVVQGITEFLPISSDGHLAVIGAVFERLTGKPLEDSLAVTIILHAGTLGSILVVYWRRLWRLVGEDRRVIPRLIIGTLPAVAIGVPLKKFGSEWLTDPLLAGCMLPLTGILLLASARLPVGETRYPDLSYGRVLGIGIAQALAILPGISRSANTISAGLAVGLRREAAATFSFLLAVPAISGAVILEMRELVAEHAAAPNGAASQPQGLAIAPLAVGAVVSFVVGLIALKWLLLWLERGKLHYFAYWCIPLGLAVVVWQAWLRFG
jgi:undecaprenyl-diphosphatase